MVEEVGFKRAAELMGVNSITKKPYTEREVRERIVNLRGRYDPEFFERENLKIQPKAGGLIPLSSNPVQRKIQEAIDRQTKAGRPVRIKIPKARRHGVSTKVQGVFFADAHFGREMQFLTVCHDLEAARTMRAMFERFHKHCPKSFPFKKVSEKLWNFPSKDINYLIDTAKEVDTGRAFTVHRLHLSEVAFYRDQETLMTGLLRTVDRNPNTMIIAESTANGWGDWWYHFITRDNDYELLFFPWFEDAGNQAPIEDSKRATFERSLTNEEKTLIDKYSCTLEQLNWRRLEIENGFNGDEDKFRQEYPSNLEESFLTSGRPYFPITIVRENLLKSEKAPFDTGFLEWEVYGESVKFVPDRFGYWKRFKEPDKNFEFRYVSGTDPSEGKAVDESNKDPDFTSITVWDRMSEQDAATFHARVDEDVVADEIYKASVYYGGSACDCVERSSSGIAIMNILKNKEGITLYVKELQAKLEDKETAEYGFQTNQSTRDTLLADLKTRVRLKHYKSNDKDFWIECSTFVYDEKGKPQGQRGTHDDRVFSAALAVQAALQAAETSPISIQVEEKNEPDKDRGLGVLEEDYVPYAEF